MCQMWIIKIFSFDWLQRHQERYSMLFRASIVDPSMFGTRQFQRSLSNRARVHTDPTSFVFHTMYQNFFFGQFYVIPILVCNNSTWSQTLIKAIDQYVSTLYSSPLNLQLFHQSRKKIKKIFSLVLKGKNI